MKLPSVLLPAYVYSVAALLAAAALLVAAGCASSATEASTTQKAEPVERYWIAGERMPCPADTARACYQVQRNDTLVAGAWEAFPYAVPGFDYRPGFLYHVRLQRASDTAFALVELINRTPDTRAQLAHRYTLTRLGGEDVVEVATDMQLPYVTFDFDGSRVAGSDGCNQLRAEAEVLSRGGDLALGPIVSTRRACSSMALPARFTEALREARRFEVRDETLLLRDGSGRVLMRLSRS